MKRILLLITLCFISIGIVNAETCEVVSGSGKEIGDEIKCGTESFYVVKNDGEKTKLLTKYNLYAGDIINFIEADDNAPVLSSNYLWSSSPYTYCTNLALEKGFNAHFIYPKVNSDGSVLDGCRIYELIDTSSVLQNKKAEGTILENGKSKLPLYGITYMHPGWSLLSSNSGNQYDVDGNLILDNTDFEIIFNGYKNELLNQEIFVDDVSFFTLRGFLDVVEKISNQNVDVNLEFSDDVDDYDEENNPSLGKMDVKEYIPEDYKWLYDRTYWLGSGYSKEVSGNYYYYDYYVSNEGFLCALGREICLYFNYPIGNGLRPIVTVDNSSIKYSYKFIEGMGQDFNIVTNTNMKFRLNMNYDDFVNSGKVYIDDKEVSKVCYKLSKGSTVITFVDDCCKEYSLGSHTIKATLNNGQYEAVTDFIISSDIPLISKVKQIVENPNTNDKMAILVFVAFTSLLVAFGIARKKLFSSKYENV